MKNQKSKTQSHEKEGKYEEGKEERKELAREERKNGKDGKEEGMKKE
jgi:hypothetical protein